MSEDQTLTTKQRRAIEGLLLAGNVAGAAEHAGCTRDSIYRWMKQPAFAQVLCEAEATAVDAVSRRLIRLADTAADTLDAAMTDAATPPAVRVRAASAVLGHVLQIRELATVEARLTELEAAEPPEPAR